MKKHGGVFNIDKKKEELAVLEDIMQAPDFWNDKEKVTDVTNKVSGLKKLTKPWEELSVNITDSEELIQMAIDENDDSLASDLNQNIEKLTKDFDDLEFMVLLNGEYDSRSCYLDINAGAGGTEACDWASMIYRMYMKWADEQGFTYEVIDLLPGEEAGIKNVTLLIKGEFAYGYLKCESGVHRLVRISPFDSNARRHTSFASVFAFPEVDDNINVEINQKDLRIDTYRAQGAGGQHVNTTDSAVRITHIPTGIVVQCQNERSQHKNRDKAMKMLKARIFEHMLKKQEEEKQKEESQKKQIAWGSQIRSYVFHPYNMVKDHRTNYEMGNIGAAMDGQIQNFIIAFLKWTVTQNEG